MDTWLTVYDLHKDAERVADSPGIAATHGVFGSSDWWDSVPSRVQSTSGVIRVSDGGPMGDWPTFEVEEADGSASRWTVRGDASLVQSGRQVQIDYVDEVPVSPPWPDYRIRVEVLIRVGVKGAS